MARRAEARLTQAVTLDCDDAMLLISSRGQRTLTGLEATHLGEHLAECTDCRAIESETAEDWRWVARMPQDAFDDPDLLVFVREAEGQRLTCAFNLGHDHHDWTPPGPVVDQVNRAEGDDGLPPLAGVVCAG